MKLKYFFVLFLFITIILYLNITNILNINQKQQQISSSSSSSISISSSSSLFLNILSNSLLIKNNNNNNFISLTSPSSTLTPSSSSSSDSTPSNNFKNYQEISFSLNNSKESNESNESNNNNNINNNNQNNKNIVIWTSDFHISTVYDIKTILNHFNIQLIDKSLSGHCYLTNTCQKNLKIITNENGISLLPCPNKIKSLFYNYYKNNKEFNQVDAFLCTHASSMCELYMPFGKPIIIISSTRFEIGRHNKKRFYNWINNLRLISSKDYNTIGANNVYDLNYIKYFSGLSSNKVTLVPSLCNYMMKEQNLTYNPINKEFIVGPSRGIHPWLLNQIESLSIELKEKYNLIIKPLRKIYPTYEYSDLIKHPAYILLPYQVSFMFLFELYSMNIPLFVPNPMLLSKWHLEYGVLSERTWDRVYNNPSNQSVLPKHFESDLLINSDPNNEFDYHSILEWVSFSDFYILPHIIQFNSFEHLISLLTSNNLNSLLQDTSNKMYEYNQKERIPMIYNTWKQILDKIQNFKKQKNQENLQLHENYDDTYEENNKNYYQVLNTNPNELLQNLNEALQKEYKIKLIENSCFAQKEIV